VRLFLYGPDGANAAADAESSWQVWMSEHFPFPQ